MPAHSKEFEMAPHFESANFCSGTGITKNTPTELLVTDLTASDVCLEFIAGIPKQEIEKIFALGDDESPSVAIKNFNHGNGSGKFLFQTTNYINTAVSGTVGTIPDSMDFRYNLGDGQKEVYGGLLENYSLEMPHSKLINQNLSWITTDKKIASLTPVTIPGYSTVEPVHTKYCTATIDGITHTNLHIKNIKFEVAITVEKDQDKSWGSLKSLEPVLLERDYTIEVEFLKGASNTWLTDRVNESNQYANLSIILANSAGTVATIAATTMEINDVNAEGYSSRGLLPRSVKFVSSVGTSVSVS